MSDDLDAIRRRWAGVGIHYTSAAVAPHAPADIQALLAALDKAQTAERAWTEIGARSEADAAAYRLVLQAVMHFWQNDPLAFGDEASPTTLAGRFAHIADLCAQTLETADAGAALLAELDAARAATPALWTCRTCGAMFPATRLDAGVTRCTRCIEVEALTARIRELERAANAPPASRAALVTGPADHETLDMEGGSNR